MLYVSFAIWRVGRFRGPQAASSSHLPPVTVMKPLCGLDPELRDNLRSFCRLDYPAYQIVFGVRSAGDPALAIACEIQREFPERDIAIVVDQRIHGANYKVSNLINMIAEAKHDVLVIVDSDMRVAPTYLARIVAPLVDPKVGAVTCLYHARPVDHQLATRLSAMFVNDWFMPSVLVAIALRPMDFCLGATMALRRDALTAVGGLEALKSYLADDFMLGCLLVGKGYEIRLSDYIVEHVVQESDLATTFQRELRGARSIRMLRPLGYAFSFTTYTLTVSGIAALLLDAIDGSDPLAIVCLVTAFVLRTILRHRVRSTIGAGRVLPLWLLPLRDAFGFGVWAMSFLGRDVNWRGQNLSVDRTGILAPQGGKEMATT